MFFLSCSVSIANIAVNETVKAPPFLKLVLCDVSEQ